MDVRPITMIQAKPMRVSGIVQISVDLQNVTQVTIVQDNGFYVPQK